MKSGSKTIYILYVLIFIIIVSVILLAKTTLDALPKRTQNAGDGIEPLEIMTFPSVNEECTFKVTYLEYGNITNPGCEGGYTRYDITDIQIGENNLNVSVIYSDKNQPKTGVYIDDKRVVQNVKELTDIKFGIFDEKLLVFDRSTPNVLAFNSKGKEIYNLKEYLKDHKVKDLSTGDTNVKVKHLDKDSFIFIDGSFEFDAITNKCENQTSKGSHYIVKYSKNKFEKPEFVKLIEC